MAATQTLNYSFNQVLDLVRSLPVLDRKKIVEIIKKEEEEDRDFTKEEVLSMLKEDLIALQNGTLKTRPASEFLDELKREGYL